MALKDFPKSWNDCNMNWDDPDPNNPVYYMAIALAAFERISLERMNTVQYNNVTGNIYALLKSIRSGHIKQDAVWDKLYKILRYLPSFVDRNSFFNSMKIEHFAFSDREISPIFRYKSINDELAKKILTGSKEFIDSCTLFASSNYYYGVGGFYGEGSAGQGEPQYLPGKPPQYDPSKYKEMYDEAYEELLNSYSKDKAEELAWYNTYWGDFGGLGYPYPVSFFYEIYRSNQYAGSGSRVGFRRDGVFLFVRKNTPYSPNVHCIVDSEDNSYHEYTDTYDEYGWRKIIDRTCVDVTAGFAPSFGKTLIRNLIVGLTETYLIESNTDLYETKDVNPPPKDDDVTDWGAYYKCDGKDTVQFVIDFNCEGGFKFRPDSE